MREAGKAFILRLTSERLKVRHRVGEAVLHKIPGATRGVWVWPFLCDDPLMFIPTVTSSNGSRDDKVVVSVMRGERNGEGGEGVRDMLAGVLETLAMQV